MGRAQHYSSDCICNLGSRLDGAENGLLSDQFWGFHLGPLPVGWQGIVPRKAGRISGIITDNTLSKLGSIREFLQAMDPDDMARIIGEQVGFELEHLIDEVMMDRNAVLWENLPLLLSAEFMHKHKTNAGNFA